MRPEQPSPRHHHRLDHDFTPRACPNPDCPSRHGAPFLWRRQGFFTRRVDLRRVQRFRCLTCRRGFSSQTFRVDYRYHRPHLHVAFFVRMVGKCSIRQAARELACHRDSLLLRLARLGPHARWLHEAFLARHRARRGGLRGTFQLDELETFEVDRRLFPLTVPVLIHRDTRFVVHVDTATLPARGNLRPLKQLRKEAVEHLRGRRKNRSKEAVTACLRALRRELARGATFAVETDQKKSYPVVLREVFGGPITHHWVHSSAPRTRANLLFAINNTLAQMRDGLGRLVRRNWGHSKKQRNLGWHLWVWALYRNYVREITNRRRGVSSASVLGVTPRRLGPLEILEWRDRLPRAA
jgi:transposase-like protein